MASLRLMFAIAAGACALAATPASPARSGILTPHRHVCPCYVPGDPASKQLDCSCGVHRSVEYGVPCAPGSRTPQKRPRRCAEILADGRITRTEAAEWNRLRCAAYQG